MEDPEGRSRAAVYLKECTKEGAVICQPGRSCRRPRQNWIRSVRELYVWAGIISCKATRREQLLNEGVHYEVWPNMN